MPTSNQAAYAAVQARRTLPYGQRPTDLHVRIMFLLARWQHASPPHAKLARAAHCHRNSVLNALHRLRDLGLLSWERQFSRLRGGWFAQTTNRYSFETSAPKPPMPKPCGPRKDASFKPTLLDRADTQAELAAIAQRRMRTLGLA